jgi:hypothetical protein
MNRKNALLLTVLLLSSSVLIAQVPRLRFDAAGNSRTRLESSYSAAGQQINTTERLFFLTDLARASSEIYPHPPETAAWSKELFVVASQMHDPAFREPGKKNALRYLSSVDPVLANQRLRDVENLPAPSGQIHDEDIRADAAVEIFVNFWERSGADSLPEIENTATRLRETGQHPYRAVGALLQRMSSTPTDAIRIQANKLFSEAFESYKQETGFQNREEEFLSLLRSEGLTLADCSLVAPALHSYAKNLLDQSGDQQAHYYAQIFVEGGDIVPFSDRNRAFLFLTAPVIRRCDPGFADALVRQYSELSEASNNKMHYISGGLFFGSPSEAGQQHIKWLQQSIVNKIREINNSNENTDPDTILRMANQLTDRPMRIVGLSGAVSALATSNQANRYKAIQIYQDQVVEARNLTDPQDKLSSAVALAQAAHSLGQDDACAEFGKQAIGLAQGILNQDSSRPGRVQRRRGYSELTQIVRLGAEAGIDSLVQDAMQISPPAMKAYLSIAAAEGIAKPGNNSRASIAKK